MGLFVRHEFDAVVDANRDGQRERLGNGFGLSHWFWLSFRHPFRINNWRQLGHIHQERH